MGLCWARIFIAPGNLLRELLRSLLSAAYNGRLYPILVCTAGKTLPMGEHFG